MSGKSEVRTVEAVVLALIPEFRQVRVGGADGRHYALTRRTTGIDHASLQVGQQIVCTVTKRRGVVLSATTTSRPTGSRLV